MPRRGTSQNTTEASRARTASLNFDRLLTVSEVAALLAMSEAWVRQHSNGMRRPILPSIKLGKSVRFRRQDLFAFIEPLVRPTR